MLDKKIVDRLQGLLELGEKVKQTRYSRSGVDADDFGRYGVDYELAQQWGTSCLSFFERVYGPKSVYQNQFEMLLPKFWDYSRKLSMPLPGCPRASKTQWPSGCSQISLPKRGGKNTSPERRMLCLCLLAKYRKNTGETKPVDRTTSSFVWSCR
jgi:hypothetical protein